MPLRGLQLHQSKSIFYFNLKDIHIQGVNTRTGKVRDKLKRDQPADSLINLYLTNIASKFGVPFTCPESNEPKPVSIQSVCFLLLFF